MTQAGDPASDRRLKQAERWLRARMFLDAHLSAALFSDPAWTIMLSGYVAHLHGRRFTVAAACADAGVPTSTALRWVEALATVGFLIRDRQIINGQLDELRLTETAVESINGMFDDLAG